jgi:hypothetical protein
MTGVLKAKVNGVWTPVEMSVPATDEVWVGSDDPGVGSSYEIWYDPDDDGAQYGTWAQGVTNLGVFNIANGTAMPTSGAVLVATVANFYYTSGRRYRLLIELNAGIANALAGNCNFTLAVDGTMQAGGIWQIYQPGMHQHFSFEFYLEKYGMSAGLHQLTIYFNHSSGNQITLHTDNATVEVRDVGPSNPMNPLTQTTPPAWIPLPFATGWQNYAGFQTCGYRKLGDMVFLRGLAQVNTALGTPTSTIATLPTGYRPLGGTHLFLSAVGEPNAVLRTEVNAAGAVTSGALSLANTNWASLALMSFSVTPG